MLAGQTGVNLNRVKDYKISYYPFWATRNSAFFQHFLADTPLLNFLKTKKTIAKIWLKAWATPHQKPNDRVFYTKDKNFRYSTC